jgi:hypothetical protein
MEVALNLMLKLGADGYAVGLLLAIVATICLYLGSKETPGAIRGNPREETSYRRRRRGFTKIGCVLLGIAFALQLLALGLSRM